MITAIKKVKAGGKYFSHEIADVLAQNVLDKKANPFDGLSEREKQVAMMVANCQSASQIADSLFVSVKTVNTYRYRILKNWVWILMSNSPILPYVTDWSIHEPISHQTHQNMGAKTVVFVRQCSRRSAHFHDACASAWTHLWRLSFYHRLLFAHGKLFTQP
ncbi:Response regulator uvrY [Moraxella lacunata]|uniref:Response regulator uvrY n=1 Tax=Moraxella lacunata TaxID=477 RepID=A0A378TVT1_MORLA|nr:Response regulator uvrY [Moraxella lacunata]